MLVQLFWISSGFKDKEDFDKRTSGQETGSIFVSIHSNAFNGTDRGFEIYTTKGTTNSDRLAELIAGKVEQLYNNLNLRKKNGPLEER